MLKIQNLVILKSCHVTAHNLPYTHSDSRYFHNAWLLGICHKDANTMDIILDKCKFQIGINMCYRYTMELPHRGNSKVY